MTAERRVSLSRRALLAASLPVMIATARADNGAETYPERQVSFIVPFAPAGGTDILARVLAQKLEQQLALKEIMHKVRGNGDLGKPKNL